jgi:hypothetical protein
VDFIDTKPTQVKTHYSVKDEAENTLGVVWAESERAAIQEVRRLTGYTGVLSAEGTGFIQVNYIRSSED